MENNHGIVRLVINGMCFTIGKQMGHTFPGRVFKRIEFLDDGTIPEVEMTSCASNNVPLVDMAYPHILCNLFWHEEKYTGDLGWMIVGFQDNTDGKDGDEETKLLQI